MFQVHPALEWQVEGLKTQYVSTISTLVVCGSIRNLNQSIQLGQTSIPIVRLNRKHRKDESCIRFVDFYLQLPYSLFQSSGESLVLFSLRESKSIRKNFLTKISTQSTSSDGCPTNAVPVFSMKMQSLDVIWHPQWMKWIDYSTKRKKGDQPALPAPLTPPPAAAAPATIPSRTNRTPDQSYARDSGLSSSLDGHTWRASSSLVKIIQSFMNHPSIHRWMT